MTIPFYQGGAQASRIRQAKQVASQRRVEIVEAQRQAREETIGIWETFMTARARIESIRRQVAAADIAREGVMREQEVGQRTVLDVLDAEREALMAKTALVNAERDYVVASYNVLAAMGKLTAYDLKLETALYEPEKLHRVTRGKFWGLSPAE